MSSARETWLCEPWHAGTSPSASSHTADNADPALLDALVRWPADVPLAAFISQAATGSPTSADTADIAETVPEALADTTWLGPWSLLAPAAPEHWLVGEPARERLARVVPVSAIAAPRDNAPHGPPIVTPCLLAVLAYDLGGLIEPRAAARAGSATDPADTRQNAPALLAPPWLLAHTARPGPAGARWWCLAPTPGDMALARRCMALLARPGEPASPSRAFALSPLLAAEGAQARYTAAVRDVLARIDSGDVYQVNLAHPLGATLAGSPRALARSFFASARPRYGAYIDTPSRTIISASPELFLSIDAPSRTIRTRPMKGTRPLRAGDAQSHADLRDSIKENAELNMIVDLMRNDLGRLSEPGSVVVERPRDIEHHGSPDAGGVLQATATIAARLEPETTLARVLDATFPPGSVTGAPKISAMRLIADLEPGPRGPYCGALGIISGDGSLTLSVAIRTAIIDPPEPLASGAPATSPSPPRRLAYWAGAGIVADSDPDAEWHETLAKAAGLASLT